MKTFFSYQIRCWKVMLLLVGLVVGTARAQAPVWRSARVLGPSPGDESVVRSSAADADGNVFMVGFFRGRAVFGSTILVSPAAISGFVAKWSPVMGDFVWAGLLSSSGGDDARAVAVDNHQVFVAGVFNGPEFRSGGHTFVNAGGELADVFLTTFADHGASATLLDAQAWGGTDSDYVTGLAVRDSSLYLAGWFGSPALTLGSDTLRNYAPLGRMNTMFVAKLACTPTGPVAQWALRPGGPGNGTVDALAVSRTGVYLAGTFDGNLTLAGATPLQAGPGGPDGFVAKLVDDGPTGHLAWAEPFGTAGPDLTNALAVQGNCLYVAGWLAPAVATFGKLRVPGSTDEQLDTFVAKCVDEGPGGRFAWVQPLGSPGGLERTWGLAVQGRYVYVAGEFSGPGTRLGAQTLPNTAAGSSDGFVAALVDGPTAATVAWALPLGGADQECAMSVSATGSRLSVAGLSTSPSMQLGAQAVTNPTYTRVGIVTTIEGIAPDAAATEPAAAGLVVVPVPARDYLLAWWLETPGEAPVQLTLIDAVGRTVWQAAVPPASLRAGHRLDLTNVSVGVYALRLLAGGTQLTRRVVVR